ncbi:unnamed protein product [Alopecurus aequalis]
MGADIENPDGGDYIAAPEKEDADAMTRIRHPTDAEFYWSYGFLFCYLWVWVLCIEYDWVKSNPANITFMVRLDLFMLVLICLAFILIYFAFAVYYSLPLAPSRKKKPAEEETSGEAH